MRLVSVIKSEYRVFLVNSYLNKMSWHLCFDKMPGQQIFFEHIWVLNGRLLEFLRVDERSEDSYIGHGNFFCRVTFLTRKNP